MAKYSGWRVECGFLTGNLDDVPAEVYARRLGECLDVAFPGAAVVVKTQSGEGSVPVSLRAAVTTPGGDAVPEEEQRVSNIMETVFDECCAGL